MSKKDKKKFEKDRANAIENFEKKHANDPTPPWADESPAAKTLRYARQNNPEAHKEAERELRGLPSKSSESGSQFGKIPKQRGLASKAPGNVQSLIESLKEACQPGKVPEEVQAKLSEWADEIFRLLDKHSNHAPRDSHLALTRITELHDFLAEHQILNIRYFTMKLLEVL